MLINNSTVMIAFGNLQYDSVRIGFQSNTRRSISLIHIIFYKIILGCSSLRRVQTKQDMIYNRIEGILTIHLLQFLALQLIMRKKVKD